MTVSETILLATGLLGSGTLISMLVWSIVSDVSAYRVNLGV